MGKPIFFLKPLLRRFYDFADVLNADLEPPDYIYIIHTHKHTYTYTHTHIYVHRYIWKTRSIQTITK